MMYFVHINNYPNCESGYGISLMSANQLFNHIDMADCTYEEIKAWYSPKFGVVEPVTIEGCWHDPKDPLKMVIKNSQGQIIETGYGTDH